MAPTAVGAGVKSEAGVRPALSRNCDPDVSGESGRLPLSDAPAFEGEARAQAVEEYANPCQSQGKGLFFLLPEGLFEVSSANLKAGDFLCPSGGRRRDQSC